MPEWFTPWLLALDALAAYRLTRLITRDSLPGLAHLRDAALDRWQGSAWAELIECPWCVGFWIACAVLAIHALAPGLWPWAAAALALSAVTGLLSEWVDR